jgi:hypothetical protein
MAMRVLYVKMDKLVEKKLFERLLPRAARKSIARRDHIDDFTRRGCRAMGREQDNWQSIANVKT